MSELKNEIKPYIDYFGFVSPRKVPVGSKEAGSGNGILYTSEYYITLNKLDALDLTDKTDFTRTMIQCQVREGLYQRVPGWTDYNEAQDDYVGLLTASYFLNPLLAKQVLNYGKEAKTNLGKVISFLNLPNWIKFPLVLITQLIPLSFNYNNVKPSETSKDSWLGRHFPLITHMYFCAGEKPPFWRVVLWCVGILSSLFSKKDDHDAWMLSWLLIVVGQEQLFVCKIVSRIWLLVFKFRFGSEAQGVCARTLLADLDHPLGKRFVL